MATEIPMPTVDAELASIPIAEMSARQCMQVVAESNRMKCFYDARITHALARYAKLHRPSRDDSNLADGAREVAAAELGSAARSAETQILQARDLVDRLPQTLSALSEGEIDLRRAAAMADLTGLLSTEDAQVVEQQVLTRGKRLTPGKFRDAIRHHVIKVDPAAAERRRKAARAQRDVTVQAGLHGMSRLIARLTANEAIVAHKRINHLAKRAKTVGDTRTVGERRADVLLDLIMGKGAHNGCMTTVDVTVPLMTLIGLNRDPGELGGYGPLTAEHARELAAHATWRRILTDPAGKVVEVSDQHLPAPGLAEHVRTQNRTCEAPGCDLLVEDGFAGEPAGDVDSRRGEGDGSRGVGSVRFCEHHKPAVVLDTVVDDQPELPTATSTDPAASEIPVDPSVPQPRTESSDVRVAPAIDS